MEPQQDINQLADHLFRHEAGKMVAVLTKIFGAHNLDLAEDVVQETLLQAMGVWMQKGIPDNPPAWLFRVAKNKAIDIIRRNKHTVSFEMEVMDDDQPWEESLIKDDMLRMMFVCCHPGISEEQQITIILKTLCGFSTAEIAKAFLTSEDTISKRLYRTKHFFRELQLQPSIPSIDELKSRTDGVLNAIYLLFNEGYNSTHAEALIRQELITEAMSLCKMITEHPHTQQPEAFALMALMCFHAARTESRLSSSGDLILLADQDRSKWDPALIMRGNQYMVQAAFGESVSRYHLEAAIAYEHCAAPSFGETDWPAILQYYEWLGKIVYSPVTELNKAVAIMQVYGAQVALTAIEQIPGREKLESFYLYHCLLGEIYTRLGETITARAHYQMALAQTHSETERRILREKLV